MTNRENGKVFVLFWKEGFEGILEHQVFFNRKEAKRYEQNVKHIPHSDIMEIVFHK